LYSLIAALIADLASGWLSTVFRASVEGTDQSATFCEGHELDRDSTALVPATAIGRMLNQDEAAKLIKRIERGIPKRPAAASVPPVGQAPAPSWPATSGGYWQRTAD
jgi:hypothetical protein